MRGRTYARVRIVPGSIRRALALAGYALVPIQPAVADRVVGFYKPPSKAAELRPAASTGRLV